MIVSGGARIRSVSGQGWLPVPGAPLALLIAVALLVATCANGARAAVKDGPATATGVALVHTRLVSSEPSKDARLAESPRQLRLVFSEPVEARLSRITLVRADSTSISVAPTGDPRNARGIVAPLEGLAPGAYRVLWRIVSADGHPIEGSYVFHIEGSADATLDTVAAAPSPPPESASGEPATFGPAVVGAPLIPALLRGVAVGALMAAAGLLLFLAITGAGIASRPGRAALWLTAGALLFLLAHLAAWIVHVLPSHGRARSEFAHALATTNGHVELARISLVLLALGAAALARHVKLALAFAVGAVLVSGAIGHSAGIHPEWAIPGKALHLLGAAAWLGGLLWLLLRERDDLPRYAAEAGRVSSIALWAVIAVAFSGIVQVRLFLPSLGDLVASSYGAVTLAKVGGLAALVAFGAYHRKRVLPRLTDATTAESFRGSLAREIAVMVAVVLLGGFLGYVPPPASDERTITVSETPR
jgi:copper transport protein